MTHDLVYCPECNSIATVDLELITGAGSTTHRNVGIYSDRYYVRRCRCLCCEKEWIEEATDDDKKNKRITRRTGGIDAD